MSLILIIVDFYISGIIIFQFFLFLFYFFWMVLLEEQKHTKFDKKNVYLLFISSYIIIIALL